MNIKIRYLVLSGCLLFGGGYLTGRYTTPEKIVTKTETKIVEVEKIVEKIVEKKIKDTDTNKEEKKNQQIHIIETTYPDGTYKKETYILDTTTVVIKEKIKEEDNKVVDKETNKNKKEESSTEKIKEFAVSEWRISAVAGVDYDKAFDGKLKDSMVYGGVVEKHILGPVYLGGFGTTTKEVGLSVGVQF